MLTSPPHPLLQAELQTIARVCAWIPVAEEFGRLDAHVLTVEATGADRSRWAVEQGDKLPADFVPHLITRQAYTALREGELGQDGSLSWKGQRWVLRQAWGGAQVVAKLVEAQ
jgi:hypothetical protein